MHSSLRALGQYRMLPQISSKRAMALAVAARAPYAMVPLGAITAITASTGSVATGGLATGLVAIATAIASPLIGRWADLRGQRFALSIMVPINAVMLLTLLTAALLAWDGPLLWLICLAVGGTALPIGSFTRARWVNSTRSPRELMTAFSYESTVDELVFVLGPALVGVAASAAVPAAPLALAAGLVIVAGIPFALTAPGVIDHHIHPDSPAVRARPSIPRVLLAVAPAVLVLVCVGSFFGSVQTGVTEWAAVAGIPGSAGLIYALMGLGSALTALLMVAVPARVPLRARLLVGGAGMAICIATALGHSSVLFLAIGLFASGLFVGPTMVTSFTLAESLSPKGGTGVAMTAMQSAITVGVSLGAAAGGALSADLGADAAFTFAVGAGVVIVTTALLTRAPRRG